MSSRPLHPPAPVDLAVGGRKGSRQWRRGRRVGVAGHCDECGEQWGPKRDHCGGAQGCHELFHSLAAFDAHRSEGWCRNPARVDGLRSNRGAWELAQDRVPPVH